MNSDQKIDAIREIIADALVIYPGDEAMRLIHKILDIINAEQEPADAE